MRRRISPLPVVAALLLIAMVAAVAVQLLRSRDGGTAEATVLVLRQRTKTENCGLLASLPDPDCTPGAIFEGVTNAEICRRGYARSVRAVPNETKHQVYAEYGLGATARGEYEVDHLISLELGGSNDIANLWPEAADPRPGFHEKDRYEDYLHDQVCSGRMPLTTAQSRIAENWARYWQDAGRP
jgi:hypothetical protein